MLVFFRCCNNLSQSWWLRTIHLRARQVRPTTCPALLPLRLPGRTSLAFSRGCLPSSAHGPASLSLCFHGDMASLTVTLLPASCHAQGLTQRGHLRSGAYTVLPQQNPFPLSIATGYGDEDKDVSQRPSFHPCGQLTAGPTCCPLQSFWETVEPLAWAGPFSHPPTLYPPCSACGHLWVPWRPHP